VRRKVAHPQTWQALLGGLVVWFCSLDATTAAFLSVTRSDTSNVLSTAKQFTISDVRRLAQPAAASCLRSAATWAGGGYSVRRSTSQPDHLPKSSSPPSERPRMQTRPASTLRLLLPGVRLSDRVDGTGSTVAPATADADAADARLDAASKQHGVVLNTSVSLTFTNMNQSLTAQNRPSSSAPRARVRHTALSGP